MVCTWLGEIRACSCFTRFTNLFSLLCIRDISVITKMNGYSDKVSSLLLTVTPLQIPDDGVTDFPSYSDTGYSDTLVSVTVFAFPNSQFVYKNHLVTVTLAYSDTFPLSRGCHCKRGRLYLFTQENWRPWQFCPVVTDH